MNELEERLNLEINQSSNKLQIKLFETHKQIVEQLGLMRLKIVLLEAEEIRLRKTLEKEVSKKTDIEQITPNHNR